MLDAELLTLGLKFHGHKCPAMPMALRHDADNHDHDPAGGSISP
jgi:hypothetical protein